MITPDPCSTGSGWCAAWAETETTEWDTEPSGESGQRGRQIAFQRAGWITAQTQTCQSDIHFYCLMIFCADSCVRVIAIVTKELLYCLTANQFWSILMHRLERNIDRVSWLVYRLPIWMNDNQLHMGGCGVLMLSVSTHDLKVAGSNHSLQIFF